MERLSLYKRVSFAVLLSILSISAHGQLHISKNEIILKEDSVKKDYSGQPYFGLYKDNYFVFGPTIGHKPTRENTNVKFQISIAQRLTKAVLPFGTYIYLFYTQKCF